MTMEPTIEAARKIRLLLLDVDGHGAVREIAELILSAQDKLDTVIAEFL